MKANQEVRKAARSAGIPFWKLGSRIGVSEQTIVRWLRTPLPNEKQQELLRTISELEREVD